MHYLWINIILIALPIAFSFTGKISFYKDFLYVLPAIIIPAAIFIVWDYFFFTWGIWTFSEKYITGIYWFGLPMEEVWFYITVPYTCLFIYACTKVYITKDVLKSLHKLINALLLLLTLVLFFAFRKQMYTSIAALVCAFMLTIRTWISRPKSLGPFYLAFFICLIPVFIVNVVINNLPIIMYNKKYILEIKVFSVPIENLFYFLALFLMNVGIYDYFKRKKEIIQMKELKNEEIKE